MNKIPILVNFDPETLKAMKDYVKRSPVTENRSQLIRRAVGAFLLSEAIKSTGRAKQ